MEIGLNGRILTQTPDQTQLKNPYTTIWEKYFVTMIHIYGAKYIVLLFGVHQDTKLE